MGHPVPDNLGNANQWAVNAARQGIPTGSSPRVGAVMVSTRGEWGHVGVVMAVNADGSFLLKEQNYDFNGSIRERTVTDPGNYTYVYW